MGEWWVCGNFLSSSECMHHWQSGQCWAPSTMTLGLSQHISWVLVFSQISLLSDSVTPGSAFEVSAEIGPSVSFHPILFPKCPHHLVFALLERREYSYWGTGLMLLGVTSV